MKKLFFVLLIFLPLTKILAIVKLPALVGDNMVLQRDANIALWGWASPNEAITIQFLSKVLKTKTQKNGKWKIILPPLAAGGPYEMIIQGKNKIIIKNIMIGDVWLASGQSNMEFILKNANNAQQEIESANFPQIRLFKVQRDIAFKPKEDVNSEGWKICSPLTAEQFSAVAYLFGRELHQHYKVPIGLIETTWGGTTAETWTSTEGLKLLPYFNEKIEILTKMNVENYEAYKRKRNAWNNEFGNTDRGQLQNGKSWADPVTNISDWSIIKQPAIWMTIKELKGYTGKIWFRKEIEIPASAIGKPLELSLGGIVLKDSTYFNGKFIGTNEGYIKKRLYSVPENLVKLGKNIIVIQVKGITDEFGGFVGTPEDLYVHFGNQKIALAGDWLYKTGPDISNIPDPGIYANFNDAIPQNPSLLYNAMIAPIIPYTMKGVIWYQGESNADSFEKASQYYSLFPALIKDWRNRWGYNFPFLFVQLAGFQTESSEPSDTPWAHLREAQYKTLSLHNTGMATAIDIGEIDDIHPKNKQDVAKRLVLTAKKVAYKEDLVFSGPTLKEMKIEKDKVRITLDNIGSGLLIKNKNGYINGFAIAGSNKKFAWAKAYLDGNDIIVYNTTIKEPVAIRYNWGNSPDGNLFNKEELPAPPFRTDNW
ncbi:MAG: sialate O-acetylesterase [Flavobacterium sp.]